MAFYASIESAPGEGRGVRRTKAVAPAMGKPSAKRGMIRFEIAKT